MQGDSRRREFLTAPRNDSVALESQDRLGSGQARGVYQANMVEQRGSVVAATVNRSERLSDRRRAGNGRGTRPD
jgi:hypothetical protein